jgi:hypothetical protein
VEIDDVEEMGRQNDQMISLVKRHCRHAKIERSPHMGVGLVEQMTGLPISGREIHCPHAAEQPPIGMDFSVTAVEFYRLNCAGCEHREAVGMPNLKMFVEDLDQKEQQREQGRQAERDRQNEKRKSRAEQRRNLVASDPKPTQEWIALLDGIDAEERSEGADRFLDIARGGAELCTPAAAEAIALTGREVPDRSIVGAADSLNRADRMPDDVTLEIVVHGLAAGGVVDALDPLVRLKDQLTADQLLPALPAIIRLAAPYDDMPFRGRSGRAEGLAIAAEKNLPALLDRMTEMIGSADQWVRSAGAGAAAVLIELEPGTGEILAPRLIDSLSLPGGTDLYMGSSRGNVQDALEAAFLARPTETAELFLRRGPQLEREPRQALYRVFDHVVRSRMNEESVPAGDVVIESLLEVAGGAHGEHAANDAAGAIELAAKYHPELLEGQTAALIGLLITAITQPLEDEPGPPELAALIRSGTEAIRSGRTSDLTKAIGQLARLHPEAVAPEIFLLLDADDPPEDDSRYLRRQLIKLLGSLGAVPGLRGEVLPRLYSALLSADQVVRGAGVDAWAELASVPHFNTPSEMEELIPELLKDSYVIVHQAMIRALSWRLPVAESKRAEVVVLLLQWAITHSNGKDWHQLDDDLQAAWSQASGLPEEMKRAARYQCIVLAEGLHPLDLARFLQGADEVDRALPAYCDRIIEALGADESSTGGGDREDELLRRLRDQPTENLLARADRIRELGFSELPRWTAQAIEFLEILEVAGAWEHAEALADEMLKQTPDDTEHAIQHRRVGAVRAHVAAEQSLAAGDLTAARAQLELWKRLHNEADTIKGSRRGPFDFID